MAIDPHSDTWADVRAAAEKAIEDSREKLERRTTTPEDTQFHRGRIAAMREILALAAPPRPGIPLMDPVRY